MASSNHRRIQFADAMHASVLSFQGKWYVVDLLARTCTCGHFQYNDIPCGHAIAVIQTYQDPAGGQCRSARDCVSNNLTLEAFKATYIEPILPVEVEGLEPQGDNDCRAPLFKKARGRPQTTRLTAGEQRGRQAAWNGALQNIRDRVQHCSRCHREDLNVLRCQAIPIGLLIRFVARGYRQPERRAATGAVVLMSPIDL